MMRASTAPARRADTDMLGWCDRFAHSVAYEHARMQSVLHTPRIQTLPHLGGKHERRERLRQEGGARSLPVPLSPVSNTVEAGLDATFRSSAFTLPRTR